MWTYDYAFCREFGKMSQLRVFRGSAQVIVIVHRGVIEIYYNITKGGGLPQRGRCLSLS